jgi:hypothetical protein
MKTTDGYELPEEHLEVIRNVCNEFDYIKQEIRNNRINVVLNNK